MRSPLRAIFHPPNPQQTSHPPNPRLLDSRSPETRLFPSEGLHFWDKRSLSGSSGSSG